jgi:hypothetical protein
MLLLICLLAVLRICQAAVGDVILAYTFLTDLEGWAVTVGNDDRERYTPERYMQLASTASAPNLVHDRRRRMASASDDSDLAWFFERRAPFNAFMNKAYGSQLV